MVEGGRDAQEKQPNKFARHHPRDVQVPSVVARLGHHEAGYIQTPVLDVFGIHVVSGSRDLQSELFGGAEEPAAAIPDLHVDAEPLAPLAVDFADVDHAGEDGLAVPVALFPLSASKPMLVIWALSQACAF